LLAKTVPIFSGTFVGCDADASPQNPRASYLNLNAWFEPYFTLSWGAALTGGIDAGGNSVFLVEFSK
jgi:hypothetical protein